MDRRLMCMLLSRHGGRCKPLIRVVKDEGLNAATEDMSSKRQDQTRKSATAHR